MGSSAVPITQTGTRRGPIVSSIARGVGEDDDEEEEEGEQ